MRELVRLLQRDAFLSREDLARQLGVTAEEVAAEIQRLQSEGVILGYQAIVNEQKFDPDRVAAMIEVKITPERGGGFDRIAERIAKFDEVKSCYLVSGGYDLLIVVEGRSLHEVARFVAEKLSTIDSVQSTATHFRLKKYKENGTFHALEETSERLPVTP